MIEQTIVGTQAISLLGILAFTAVFVVVIKVKKLDGAKLI